MDDITFQALPLDGAAGLRLVGELDMATCSTLQIALASLPPGTVTLDCAELTFIDSSGFHVIAKYAETRNGSGKLVLENVSDGIRRIFEITLLDRHPGIELKAASLDGR